MEIKESVRRRAKGVAESPVVRALSRRSRLEAKLAQRFRAGETVAQAADVALELRQTRTAASLDLLAAPATTLDETTANAQEYLAALSHLSARGLAAGEAVDLTVRPAALGLHLAGAPTHAGDLAELVVGAATRAGTSVTLALEPAEWTDEVLALAARLRADHPRTAVSLDARLHRTEADVAGLTGPGVRVRLVQGPKDTPRAIAWHNQHEADLAWVRCVKTLVGGAGEPLIDTDDMRLADVASVMANLDRRRVESFEYQVTLGANTEAALRLSDSGYRVRVRLPYGEGWYAEALQRLADRPDSMTGLLRPVSHAD